MTHRLIKSLDAYAQLLRARYAFSAAHKLPGSKGKLREDAVAEFLSAFVPANQTVATNVFATTINGYEYPREIDLVVHDAARGGLWHLDTFGENVVCNLEGITAVMEVKSILGPKELEDAELKAGKLKAFCDEHDIKTPPFVLFCYDVAPEKESPNPPYWMGKDTIDEKALEARLPFAMTVCPGQFCYVSDEHDEFAFGFEQGLSSYDAQNDGTAQDRIVSLRYADSRYARQFINVGTSAGQHLLAIAAFVSDASGQNSYTGALLSSATRPRRNPIWPVDTGNT